MKLLIAVKSCHAHRTRGDHDIIRGTWGQDIPPIVDLRFFVGWGTGVMLGSDEVQIDAPDDYDSLTLKTIEICRWAVANGYDHVFFCDTDTYVNVPKLMGLPFRLSDYYGVNGKDWGVPFRYTGRTRGGQDFIIPHCYPWASGGFGYFLSFNAMGRILAATRPDTPVMIWCEDMWVGQQMGEWTGIRVNNLHQGEATWHFPQHVYHGGYEPKFGWMEKMHRETR